MKYLLYKSLLYTSILLFISACVKEEHLQQQDYPRIITHINSVDSTGVVLRAEIPNSEYFTMYDEAGFILSNGVHIKLTQSKGLSTFTFHVRTGIEKDLEYTVRSYAVIKDHRYIGTLKKFVGKGCLPLRAKIDSLSPKLGIDGTKIEITGKNFGFDPRKIDLKFGGYKFPIDSINETTIYARVPSGKTTKEYTISLDYGSYSMNVGNFEIVKPIIIDYSPKKAYGNSALSIKGKYFGKSINNSTVYINSEKCRITSICDSLITVRTPQTSFSGQTDLNVITSSRISTKQPFEVLRSIINSITPYDVTVGTIMTINGKGLISNIENTTIFINDIDVKPTYVSSDTIIFEMPQMSKKPTRFDIHLPGKNLKFNSTAHTMSNTWELDFKTKIPNISIPISCQVGDKIYCGFSTDFRNLDNAFYEFDINTKQWNPISIPSDIRYNITTSYTNKYFFEYKEDLHLLLQSTDLKEMLHFKFNLSTKKWSKLNYVNDNIFNWVEAYNGAIYASATDNKIYRFNSESLAWEYQYTSTHKSAIMHFKIDGKLYVLPINEINNTENFFEFNPETGKYIAKDNYPEIKYPNRYYQKTIINGNAYLLNRSNKKYNTLEYNPNTDKWSTKTPFTDNRQNLIGFHKDNDLYIGMGDFWKYTE